MPERQTIRLSRGDDETVPFENVDDENDTPLPMSTFSRCWIQTEMKIAVILEQVQLRTTNGIESSICYHDKQQQKQPQPARYLNQLFFPFFFLMSFQQSSFRLELPHKKPL